MFRSCGVVRWLSALSCCGALAGGCAGDAKAPPNVMPGEVAVIAKGPATLTIPAGEHLVVEGRGAVGLRVDITVARADADVPIDPGESRLSAVVTIEHDRDGPIAVASSDPATPFARLRLAFDPALVPAGAALDPSRVIVVARYPQEVEGDAGPEAGEMVSARALGDVDLDAGLIEVEIATLPERMDVAVVHAPHLAFAAGEQPVNDPAGRTAAPPWPCCAAYVVYPSAPADRDCSLPEFDGNGACRLRALARATEGGVDPAAIDRVIQKRVVAPALVALRSMLELGLRQPKVEHRALGPGGRQHAIIFAGWGVSRYRLTGPFPEVHLAMTAIEAAPGSGRSALGELHHELTHAAVEGYDIRSVFIGDTRALRGFNEGLAVVVENTRGAGATVAQVRTGYDHAIYRLGMPLGDYELPYANDDFFGYLFRRYLDNDLRFIGGDEGLLEMLALYSDAAGLATGEDYRVAYLRGLDDALRGASGASAGAAFDAFIRDRFYEHGAASRLRAEDKAAENEAVPELFSESQRLVVPVGDELDVEIPSQQAPLSALDALPPMTARLVGFEAAGGFEGELRLEITPIDGELDVEGLRVTLYPDGAGPQPLSGRAFVDATFGQTHARLWVLVVNTSLDGPAGVSIVARTGKGEEPPPPPEVECPEEMLVRECLDGRCEVYGGTPCDEHGPAVAWPLEPYDALYKTGEVIAEPTRYRIRCSYQMPSGTCGVGLMAYWTTPAQVGGAPSYPQYACDDPGEVVTVSLTLLNSKSKQAAVSIPGGVMGEGTDPVFRQDVLTIAEDLLERVEAWAAPCP
ncbi:MAG: hypothetical protein IT385_17770 [Deltaproteobacteria bacterium]|nr:hypothetical protein [Deltaproteobacteria bacterium]